MKLSDAVLGAVLALSGVLLTLISTHINELIKSSRDRKNTQKQRELSLKREIYIPLVQAFTEGINLLTLIPNAHHAKLSELVLSKESRNAIAAKDLIANNAAMIAVNNAGKQLAQGIIRLMSLKLDEAKLAIDLEFLEARINELSNANRLVIDKRQTLREAGELDPDVASRLDSEFELNDSELKILFKQKKEKMSTNNQIMQSMQKQMIKEITELTAVSAYAIIEIRQDLDMPTDKALILENYRASIEFLEEMLPGFVDEVWDKVLPTAEG